MDLTPEQEAQLNDPKLRDMAKSYLQKHQCHNTAPTSNSYKYEYDNLDADDKTDLTNKIKTNTYKILSLPIKVEKRGILEKRLKDDEYVDKYLQHRIKSSCVKYLNSDIKFALTYIYHYNEARNTQI